jgi:hypothetical protein
MKLAQTHIITISVMVLVTVLLVVLDIIFALNGVQGDTISALIIAASLQCPMIPYAFGCVGGHLFHRTDTDWPAKPWYFPGVIMPAAGLFLWLVWAALDIAVAVGSYAPLLPFLAGVAAGASLWENRGQEGE